MVDGDGTTQDGTPKSDGTTPEPETPLTVEALQAQIAQRDEQIAVITKERDTAKSVAGNVQKRQSEDERWEALQAGITHTRLLSEAALKGFSETEAAQYVAERQGRDGLIRQVNDIGHRRPQARGSRQALRAVEEQRRGHRRRAGTSSLRCCGQSG